MVVWLRGAFVLCVVGVATALMPEGMSFQSVVMALLDNSLLRSEKLRLADGVEFVKTSDALPRSQNGESMGNIFDSINLFLKTHTLRFDFKDADVRAGIERMGRAITDTTEAVIESRGKKKDKGMSMKNLLLPIILALKAKLAILSAVAGNTIAIIAAKALLVSKLALVLGFFLFLKKLATNPPKDVMHKTIKHEHVVVRHEDHGGFEKDDWGSFGRIKQDGDKLDSAQDMAYRAQKRRYYG